MQHAFQTFRFQWSKTGTAWHKYDDDFCLRRALLGSAATSEQEAGLSPDSIHTQVVPEELGALHCEFACVVELSTLIPPARGITGERTQAG